MSQVTLTLHAPSLIGSFVMILLGVSTYMGAVICFKACILASFRLWRILADRNYWYRPSRRATRQLILARKKHARLLEAYKKLRTDCGLRLSSPRGGDRAWTEDEVRAAHFYRASSDGLDLTGEEELINVLRNEPVLKCAVIDYQSFLKGEDPYGLRGRP